MCPEPIIRRFAGVFLLASIALAVWVSPWWLAFTAFVGFNLLQSSFSAFCPLEKVLGRLSLCGCAPANADAISES
jgi:hypothetical protein